MPESEWRTHPLLSRIHVDARGVPSWDVGVCGDRLRERRLEQLSLVTFPSSDSGTTRVARVPPRLNVDWFVDDQEDEEAPAPIWGRARDIARFYERNTGAFGESEALVCAEAADDIRRYFEWLDDIWVRVSRSRWLTIRADPSIREITRSQASEHFPRALAAPRPVHPEVEPPMTVAEARVQAARAEAIATITHHGQTGASGERYIYHPARVASHFDVEAQPIEHCAAWLHDALRDGSLDADALIEAGMRRDVVEVVALLTRRPLLFDDDEYYERIRGDRRALRVLAADIDDGGGS